MEIRLKKMTLMNFKGVKNLSIDFTDRTVISGDNGTGKTTIEDAFTWLLFGKDSEGNSTFEIKTLDENGIAYPKIDHEVSAIIEIDGIDVNPKRTFREKWVKPRGESEALFNGHETIFAWNDVPMSATEYKTRIDSICNESVFKMVTDPMAFNRLKWQDRRSILFTMCGDVTHDEVLSSMVTPETKNAVAELALIIESGKSFEEYKRETAAKKKKIREELNAVPGRIDENNRMKPQPVDAKSVQAKIDSLTTEIEGIDKIISDKAAREKANGEKRAEQQCKVNEIKATISELKNTAEQSARIANRDRDNKIAELNAAIASRKRSMIDNDEDRRKKNLKIKDIESTVAGLRSEWSKINESKVQINESDTCCPACKRELDNAAERRDELTANFNRDKTTKLDDINKRGRELNSQIESVKEMLDNLNQAYEAIGKEVMENEKELAKLNSSPKVEPTYPMEDINELSNEISAIEENMTAEAPVSDNELTNTRRKHESERSSLQASLMANDRIAEADKRIADLEASAKTMGQEIANLERSEFHINEFTKRKIDLVESRINAMFEAVRFKMYKQLINEGEEECCEVTVGGVPFNGGLNNAARINAGLDIICALCNYYQLTAPVFIDNAESVNNIKATPGQQILLLVTKDNQLVISN